MPQRLNSLATIEGQLGDRGLAADRKILEYAFGPSTARAREVLGCDQVLRVKRLNLANGEPFAVVTVWCPAEIGHHFSRHDVEQRPFYELVGITLARRHPDHRRGHRDRGRCRAAGRAARQPGAALRADHH
ncbi:MAG: UTRA domain-containing protein [Ilumatobacteraceae bacterium]